MYRLKQNDASRPLLFLMVLSSNHIDPATGLSPTVTISKNGAAFASPAGAVTEIANGWYKVAGNATDTNTLGPLLLHATVATADPADCVYDVDALVGDVPAAIMARLYRIAGVSQDNVGGSYGFLLHKLALAVVGDEIDQGF